MTLDTKTSWLTDRQSQSDFDFDYKQLGVEDSLVSCGVLTSEQRKRKNLHY
jgi:hypothetical protein